MARNGKIARLPRNIRDQLNRRLDEGESGVRLVAWLNSLPEVQAVLDQDFEGRPINEQNLTEWRQGGYLVWARLQESWEWWQLNREEGDRIATDSGPVPLSDSLSPMVALVLGKTINDLFADSPADPAHQKKLLALLAELSRLRRTDHEAARLRIHLEENEKRRAKEREADARAAKEAARRSAEAAEREAEERIAQERTAIIEKANRRYLFGTSRPKAAKQRPNEILHPPAASTTGPGPAESNQIKPNQASAPSLSVHEPHDLLHPP
jgi:hypothetical protein